MLKIFRIQINHCGSHIKTQLVNCLKRLITRSIPSNVKFNCIYKASKLASYFSVKDKTKLQHRHNIIYRVSCPEKECESTYVGESARHLQERVTDHNTRDKKSSVLKHCQLTGHHRPGLQEFKIIGANYSHYFKRKLLTFY